MNDPQYFLTAPQIIGSIRRQWFPATIFSLLIIGIAATSLWLMRNVFVSEGQFYLKAGRATMALDPTVTTGTTASLLDSRQTEIQSIKEMLGNRQLLESVAARVGVDRINDQQSVIDSVVDNVASLLPRSAENTYDGVLDAAEAANMRKMENAVQYIDEFLSIGVSKEANTISIRAKAHSPYLARDIVDATMNEFIKRYVEVHRTTGSLEFFERQVAQAAQVVLAREQELRDLKNSLKLMTVQSKRELIQQEFAEYQKQLIDTSAMLTGTAVEVTELESQLVSLPKSMDAEQTQKPNVASEKMREQLYALEIQESDLSSKYHDSHPSLLVVRDKLNTSRKIFADQSTRSDEQKTTLNPLYQKIEAELLAARARRESLEAKRQDLINRTARVEEKLATLNADEVHVAEQERLVDLARADYVSFAKKLEEARIRSQLDESLINDLSIAQPASLVLKKTSPPRALLLAVISLAAVGLGLIFAIWRDQQAYFASFAEPKVDFKTGRKVPTTAPSEPDLVHTGVG
jgi:polysaccharide biosynthesis protein PslE